MPDEDDTSLGLAFEERVETRAVVRVVQETMRHELQGFVGTPRITGMRISGEEATVEADVVLDVPANYIRIQFDLGENMTKQFDTWGPETPESALEGVAVIQEVDPRVDSTHQLGVLPVPANPPPPTGWEYWGKQPVPKQAAELCMTMLHAPSLYPMGAFARIKVGEKVIGARVEWHDIQGATGKRGCFRGVNLLHKVHNAV